MAGAQPALPRACGGVLSPVKQPLKVSPAQTVLRPFTTGCGLSAPDQTEFPGYVEGSAPKNQRPAYCATLKGAGGMPPAFDCARSAGGVRRLCPCQPVPGTRQSGQVDALGGGGSNGGSGSSGAAQATEGGSALQTGQQDATGGTQR